MKKIFLILAFTFVITILWAQNNLPSPFKTLNSDKLYWECVYQTDKTLDELFDYFLCEEGISFTKTECNKYITAIRGDIIVPIEIRVRDNAGVPTLYFNPMSCYIIFEYKEGRYRVIASDITFTKDGGVMIDGWGRTGSSGHLFDDKIKDEKGGISISKINLRVLEFLNNHLQKRFSVKERYSPEW